MLEWLFFDQAVLVIGKNPYFLCKVIVPIYSCTRIPRYLSWIQSQEEYTLQGNGEKNGEKHHQTKCNCKASMCSYLNKNPMQIPVRISVLLSHPLVWFIAQVKVGPLTSDTDQYANTLEKVLCPECEIKWSWQRREQKITLLYNSKVLKNRKAFFFSFSWRKWIKKKICYVHNAHLWYLYLLTGARSGNSLTSHSYLACRTALYFKAWRLKPLQ